MPQAQASTLNNEEVDSLSRIKELETQLAIERAQSAQLRCMLNDMRHSTATILNTCEQAQEGVTNRLIREISRLKSLQLAMCDDVETQEARLVEVLEERLRTLKAEKCELENALEQEQERIVNRLQRQMDELRLLAGHASSTNTSTSPAVGIAATNSSPLNLSSNELASSINTDWPWREREAELHRQIVRLQEENQQLLWQNVKLQNRLRRQSIEDSPLLEPVAASLSPAHSSTQLPIPLLRRSDSVSSTGNEPVLVSSPGTSNGKLLSTTIITTKSGSIADLHHQYSPRRRSLSRNSNQSDSDRNV